MMYRNRKKWFVLIPFVFIAAVALFGWIVMLLWNAALVPAAGAGVISFWQALCLLVLSRILVGGLWKGGGSRWGGGHAWKQKWAGMSEEEKEKVKQEWQKRCGRFSNSTSATSSAKNVEAE